MDILEGLPSTPEVLDLFCQSIFVSNMLRFEASLARAQASVGLIPETAAQSIMDTCKVELFDVPKIVGESTRVGNISLSLVKSLKETVSFFNPDAVGFVHHGATSQDVVNTALALATRDALGMIEMEVHKVVTTLLMLAEGHASAPALERSLTQPATVTSFGYKCVLWAAPLVRSLQRLQTSALQSFCVQLGWFTPFIEQTLALDAVDPLAAQLEHFCNLILGHTKPLVSVADALQSLRTVEAVRQSIATGKTVALKNLA